jgi:ATP-dependent exoDNAse (exonuclease V) beta subunit
LNARFVEAADRLVPLDLREPWLDLARNSERRPTAWPSGSDPSAWAPLLSLVLTKNGEPRKQFTVREGFRPDDRVRKQQALQLVERLIGIPGMVDALAELRKLPPPRYSDPQWQATLALLDSLRLAAGQLRQIFRERGVTDFAELGMAACHALGDGDHVTDLAFRLDARMEHLLVDEFQDTSRGQLDLIRLLTANWTPGDGRTLFLVGDPMQSIYRFRQAEVGIFLETRERGIGPLRPQPLNLISNYRSEPEIVDRINEIFQQLFPEQEDSTTGAVPFHRSEAFEISEKGRVAIHGFQEREDAREAERVVALIREAQTAAPQEKIAVLVRARTHLPWIVEALKSAKISYQAVEIDPLAERTVVLDLLALTRAMLHRADRIAWLAILRAPWCGLGLADLEKISRGESSIWNALQELGSLTTDGQARAAKVRDILTAAFADRSRWPLRRWVERAWIQLGGLACLDGDEGALADALAYFDRLEQRQSGSDIADLPQLEKGLADLFAQPDPHASDRLQIMTIHKAKGLEFDTVIVAGLGRPDKMDDAQLVLFHEWGGRDWGEDHAVERLIAPMPEPGGSDPLYEYLKKIESRKSALERVRLLYVAATRARKNLHMLGQATIKKNGETKPEPKSMLADLWGALTEEERASFARPVRTTEPVSGIGVEGKILRRLPISWTLPELPLNLSLGQPAAEAHEPTFEWVGESLRIAGTVVHELLRRARDGRLEIPPVPALRRLLLHAGVIPSEIGATLHRVTEALTRMQTSERARWILADHRGARTEYAISGIENGEIVRGKIDRTFVDEHGTRWIIDFKTSTHEGGGLEEFLDEEQRRYRDQLERYARLFAPRGEPVRVGLYFPLLDEWREWAP